MRKYLVIIQARLGSTRFPNKVLETVNGISLVRRVWDAANSAMRAIDPFGYETKVIVAWPERYPDLDQNNVLERFRRISREFPSRNIVRLTADCPMLEPEMIVDAINEFERKGRHYYTNRIIFDDGFDVQVFSTHMLHASYATHREHVIIPDDNLTLDKYLSVNTPEDLEFVRQYAR